MKSVRLSRLLYITEEAEVTPTVHVTERHAVENMGFLALSSVIFDVLRGVSFALTISFPFVTDALGSIFNAMNDVVAERAYSRKLETEADTLGLLVRAPSPQSSTELSMLLVNSAHGQSRLQS